MNKKRYNPDFNFSSLNDHNKRIKSEETNSFNKNFNNYNSQKNLDQSNSYNNNTNTNNINNNSHNGSYNNNINQVNNNNSVNNSFNSTFNSNNNFNRNNIKEEITRDPTNDLMNNSGLHSNMNNKDNFKTFSTTSSKINDPFNSLPISKKKDEIIYQISANQCTIISGETGCGKTTQVPKYIIENFAGAKILMTQPRRIAVVSIYERYFIYIKFLILG